jgi:hypothetical protein
LIGLAAEVGTMETALLPREATMIKKKINKNFVTVCLFIASKIRINLERFAENN